MFSEEHKAKVIERSFFRHKNGRVVSVYGAVPWGNEIDKKEWELVTEGYTIQNRNGTVGSYGLRNHDFESVVAFVNRMNEKRR